MSEAKMVAPDKEDSDSMTPRERGSRMSSEQALQQEDRVQFQIELLGITKCGTTCREVTLELTNAGNTTVRNITTEAVIRAGEAPIWNGTEEVGTLEAEETYQTTKRVEISGDDVLSVKRNENVIIATVFLRTAQGDFIVTQAIDVNSMERVSMSPPDLQGGRQTKHDIGRTAYYLIDHIPGQPANRTAVTTTDYQLVSKKTARDVIGHDVFSSMQWGMDWQQYLQRIQQDRERIGEQRLWTRALDLGWDATEILILWAVGVPQAGIATVFETSQDLIRWSQQAQNRPYRETYTKMSGTLGNTASVENLASRLEQEPSIFEKIVPILDAYNQIGDYIDEGRTLKSAFSTAIKAAIRSGPLTESPAATISTKQALHKSRGFLISLAVGAGIDLLDNPIQLKSRLYGVAWAYCTMVIPVLERLQRLDRKIKRNNHRFGDRIEYYLDIQSFNQMTALAAAGQAKYWQAIADTWSGVVLNFITNADDKAKENRGHAKNLWASSRSAARVLGTAWGEVSTKTDQSVNAVQERTNQQLGTPQSNLVPINGGRTI